MSLLGLAFNTMSNSLSAAAGSDRTFTSTKPLKKWASA